jgi:bacterioferritin-associated ferredoxin
MFKKDKAEKQKKAINLGMNNIGEVMKTIGHVQSCVDCQQRFLEIVRHADGKPMIESDIVSSVVEETK